VHRFFAPALDPGDESVALPRDEAEHLTRVLRLGPGDLVAVFDGRGREFTARVVSARRRDVRVALVDRVTPAAESPVALTLAQAVLKAEHMDDVVRDAVMLGVSAIQPLVTTRTEATVAALLRGARVERWRRVALASVKQSGRAMLPDVRTPLTFESYLGEPRAPLALMLVEPRAGAPVEPMAVLRSMPCPSEATIVVGPEGGWTEEEWRTASDRGVRLLSMGRRTLRADAVAVAALSVLQFLWDEPA
jgi:16S rRNA (uracil1498-N3)-methyltransferase